MCSSDLEFGHGFGHGMGGGFNHGVGFAHGGGGGFAHGIGGGFGVTPGVALAYAVMAAGLYALGRTSVSVPYTAHMDMPHAAPAE